MTSDLIQTLESRQLFSAATLDIDLLAGANQQDSTTPPVDVNLLGLRSAARPVTRSAAAAGTAVWIDIDRTTTAAATSAPTPSVPPAGVMAEWTRAEPWAARAAPYDVEVWNRPTSTARGPAGASFSDTRLDDAAPAGVTHDAEFEHWAKG